MSTDNVKPLRPARNSRLSGLHRDPPGVRRERLINARWFSAADAAALEKVGGFEERHADAMVENVIGVHGLPLAVALNFRINGEDRVIPMAVEEPSIVAACSYAALLTRATGGFDIQTDPPIIAAQIQLLDLPDVAAAAVALRERKQALLDEANALIPRMVERGGGAVDLDVRLLEQGMVCVHVHVDCRDAMGANTVNHVAEALAPRLARLTGGRAGLKILSNLSDRRKVYVKTRVAVAELAGGQEEQGARVRDAIIAAQRFAELDPYRATTHNKGVMNGVDAVLVALGNDWRAVEAGAHAFAASSGTYRPLTSWARAENGDLEGQLVMPLATSTVGGAALAHPGVKLALRLAGVRGARDLSALAGAAGLASNLAALKALSTEGIQRGHMALHARRIAVEAGATGRLVEVIAAQLSKEKTWKPERARELVVELMRDPVRSDLTLVSAPPRPRVTGADEVTPEVVRTAP